MPTRDELQEHHRLQLRMVQVVKRVAEIEQTKALNNSKQAQALTR